MKTVLLAIDGEKPHQSVMLFAVQFCRRMKVALDVVHFVRPEQSLTSVFDVCWNEDAREKLKQSAECNAHHLLKSENPPKAISQYINAHRNIVLAIYDTQKKDTKNKTQKVSKEKDTGVLLPKGFEVPLAVPLVIMRS